MKLIITILITFQFSCLLAGIKRGILPDKPLEIEPNPYCDYYAEGKFQPKTDTQKLFSSVPLLISVSVIDIAIIYSLSILNPWYGFIYFALGLGFASGEKLGPFDFNTWCGSPENPTQPPGEYYYFIDIIPNYSQIEKEDSTLCRLDATDKFRFLYATASSLNVNFDEKIIEKIITLPEIRIQLVGKKAPRTCVYYVYVTKGKAGLREIINGAKRNGG